MFSERLRVIRKRNRQTQSEMADALGVSTRTIANWESGDRTPTIETLSEIAGKYSVSTDYLLGKEEEDINDDDIKFAVFGDPDVTDAQFEEVKQFARFVKERDRK